MQVLVWILGKNLVEYIRAKYIDVPVKFLERGRLRLF